MPSNVMPGYSFAPTFDNAEDARRGGTPAMTAQDPLQVLSYRLPKWTGAGGGLSPQQSQTMAGGIGNAVLESVIRTVLGPDASSVLDTLATGQQPLRVSPPPPPRRVEVPGVVPTAIDTGVVRQEPRGPQRPTVTPNPDPNPFRVPVPEERPDPVIPTEPRPVTVMPGDESQWGLDPGAGSGRFAPPSGPPQFEPATAGRSPWSRAKSSFLEGVDSPFLY